jgi:hypothetical protein
VDRMARRPTCRSRDHRHEIAVKAAVRGHQSFRGAGRRA